MMESIKDMIPQDALEKFLGLTRPSPDGCILWTQAPMKSGYGAFSFAGKQGYAHRAAWELANKRPIPKGMYVCHSCDVRLCVNPEHLFLGTALDNNRDAIAKGRTFHPCGESRPDAKLRAADILEIRASHLSQRKLAAQYGVAKGVIQNIRNRTKWRSV